MNLRYNLLEHQQKAFQKFKHLSIGALFMETGTGKTRTMLEIIKYRLECQKIKKIFWFTPVSTKNNLMEEIKKHSDIEVYIYPHQLNESNDGIIIVGIESLSISNNTKIEIYNNIDSDTMLIVDETTLIKNHYAKRSDFLLKCSHKTNHKYILNATPTTNSVADLYSQMKFLSPKILGYRSFNAFKKAHLVFDEKNKFKIIKSTEIDHIKKRIEKFVFFAKKEQCFELPKKNKFTHYVKMNELQEKYYMDEKNKFFESIINDDILILKFFTNLQKISCGFTGNFETGIVDIGNPKIKKIKEILHGITGKTLIFYKFKYEGKKLQEELNIPVIDGDTTLKVRENILNEIKNTTFDNVVAINLGCGCYGLNLQYITNIIYFSNVFNFSKNIQSEDRIHRYGITEEKNIHYLIASNMEKKIQESIIKKEKLLNYMKNKYDEL